MQAVNQDFSYGYEQLLTDMANSRCLIIPQLCHNLSNLFKRGWAFINGESASTTCNPTIRICPLGGFAMYMHLLKVPNPTIPSPFQVQHESAVRSSNNPHTSRRLGGSSELGRQPGMEMALDLLSETLDMPLLVFPFEEFLFYATGSCIGPYYCKI